MEDVFIHRGIVVQRGFFPADLLTVRNSLNGHIENPEIDGVFIYPSTASFMEERRKSVLGFTERYTKKNPDLEPLILTFRVTEDTFELLNRRFAIVYLAEDPEPIPDFYSLLSEAKHSDIHGDPQIIFNGEGLTLENIRQLELVVGCRNSEGEFVYRPHDEYMIQKEGTVSRCQEVK